MKVHPAMAALRGAPASQRRPFRTERLVDVSETNAALTSVREAWLVRPETQSIADALRCYGSRQELEACKALDTLMRDYRSAKALVGELMDKALLALRQHSLAEVPFRFKLSQGLATLQLMQCGGATLSLAAYEPLPGAEAPPTALFSDREVHELVLCGEASGVSHRWEGEGRLTSAQHRWQQGSKVMLRARCEARQILKVERSLLLLQLTREPKRPAPTRLVSLETGETQHAASGDKPASQAVMALSVLGALKTRASLEVMEQTACNLAEDQDVRWEALRQALGIDTACGLKLLSKLQERIDDPLANPSRALCAQLFKAHPELRDLTTEAVA